MAGKADCALELRALRFLNEDLIGSGCRYLCRSSRLESLPSKSSGEKGIVSGSESDVENEGNEGRDPACITVSGPFGPRPLLYFDFAATGRALKSVENAVYRQLLPNVANTHTHQSALGRQATFFLHEARQIGKEFFNAGHEDGLYFCGSGASAAAAKFLQLLLISAPQVANDIHSRVSSSTEGERRQLDTASVAAAAFALLSGSEAQSAATTLADEGRSGGSGGHSYVRAFSEAFEEDRWQSFRCVQCNTRLKTPLHARRHLYEHAALDIHRRALQKDEGTCGKGLDESRPVTFRKRHLHIVFLCDASAHHSSFLPFRAVASSSISNLDSSCSRVRDETALTSAALLSGAFCFPREKETSLGLTATPGAVPDVSYGFRFLPLNIQTGGLCLRGLQEALISISQSCAAFNDETRKANNVTHEINRDQIEEPSKTLQQCSCEAGNSKAPIHLCCLKSFKAYFDSLFKTTQKTLLGEEERARRPEVCVVPVCILSAASNVTGTLLSNCDFIDSLQLGDESEDFQTCLSTFCAFVHAFGGIVAVDCAAAAAYVRLDFNPILSQEAQEAVQRKLKAFAIPPGADFEHPWRCADKHAASPDAFFVSTHKLLGGTGAAGLLLVKKRLLLADSPAHPAGGTVFLVNAKWRQQGAPEQQEGAVHCVYAMDRSEAREEGGSPNLPAICRAALALRTLHSMPLQLLRRRESKLVRQLIRVWSSHPKIHLVGSAVAPRVGIISFLIKYDNATPGDTDSGCSEESSVRGRRCGGLYLHPNFVVRLLSDLFGVQCRSGCLCAGPFTAFSLDLSADVVAATETLLLLTGQELLRPGVVRVSVSFAHTRAQLQQLLLAVLWIANHGFKMLHCYNVDPETGEWTPTREAITFAANAPGASEAGVKNGGSSDDSYRIWLSACVASLEQREICPDANKKSMTTHQFPPSSGDPAEDILRFPNAVLSGVLYRSGTKGSEVSKLSAPPLPLHLPSTSSLAFRFPQVQRRPRLGPENEAAFAAAMEQSCAESNLDVACRESAETNAYMAQMRQSVASLVWFALPADGLASVQSWCRHQQGDKGKHNKKPARLLNRLEALASQVNAGAKVHRLLNLLSRPGEEALEPLISRHAVRWVEGSAELKSLRPSDTSGSTQSTGTASKIFDEMQHLRALDSVFEPRRFISEATQSCKCIAGSIGTCENCKELLNAVDDVMESDGVCEADPGDTVSGRIPIRELHGEVKKLTTRRNGSIKPARLNHTRPHPRSRLHGESSPKAFQHLPMAEKATSLRDSKTALQNQFRHPARSLTNGVFGDESGGLSKAPLLPIPRHLRRTFGQALHAFKMLRPGDRLLLGLSGGKDSLTLLHLLRDLRRRAPFPFSLAAATVDPMTPSYDPAPLGPYLESLGIHWFRLQLPIMELAKIHMQRQSICAFCSRLRRGLLYSCMRKHDFNVLVLGQHLDDLAESFLMSAFHNGALNTMKAHYVIGAGELRVIRPLVFTREADLQSFAEGANLPIIKDNCPACFAHPKERHRVKLLLSEQEREFPNLFSNIQKTLLPLMAIANATHSSGARNDVPVGSPYEDSTAGQKSQCHRHACTLKSEEAEDAQIISFLKRLNIDTSENDHENDFSLKEIISAGVTESMEARDEEAVLSLTACGLAGKTCSPGLT